MDEFWSAAPFNSKQKEHVLITRMLQLENVTRDLDVWLITSRKTAVWAAADIRSLLQTVWLLVTGHVSTSWVQSASSRLDANRQNFHLSNI